MPGILVAGGHAEAAGIGGSLFVPPNAGTGVGFDDGLLGPPQAGAPTNWLPPHAGPPGPGGILFPPPHEGVGAAAGEALLGPLHAEVPVAGGSWPGARQAGDAGLVVAGVDVFLEAAVQAELDWPGTIGEPKLNLPSML